MAHSQQDAPVVNQMISADVLEGLGDAFTTVDRDFRFTYVNSTCEKNSGRTRESLLGRIIWDEFHPLKGTPFEALYRRVMAERRPGSTESYYAHRQAWYETRAYPLNDGGIAIHVRDVTDRKTAERGLAETQELLSLACEAGLIGTFCWAFNEGKVRVSPEIIKLYELNPPDCRPEPQFWYDRLHPADRERVHATLSECFRNHQDFINYDFRVVLRDGGFRWLHSRANIRYGNDGSPSQMVGINIDITQLKQLEEQLLRSNTQLRRSNQDLEHFAYVASHDLQEPLRMVSAYTELLLRRNTGKLDDESNQFGKYITEGVRRMGSLITGLLEFSKLATDGDHRVPTDLNVALRTVLSSLAPLITQTGATVTSDQLPTILVDDGPILQVLQNLISNAMKYRGADPPQIHVAAQRETSGWTFSVTDNGIGFDPKYAEMIFGVFRRLNSNPDIHGAGIGLAVVQRIIDRHGGRVWAESKPGEGSTFYFTIPDSGAST